MKKIKATHYKTDGTFKKILLKNGEGNLEKLQGLVGGNIEVVCIIPDGDPKKAKDLVINEEGRLLDLPSNPFSSLVGKGSIWRDEIFVGNMVLIDGFLP